MLKKTCSWEWMVPYHDRLLDFSTAVTGTLFFVPTVDMLGDFAG